MKMTISVGSCLKRKIVKEYINKDFKKKHPNENIGLSKFCALKPKWCFLAGSEMTHCVCACSAHQNVVLLVDTMDLDLTYKDLIKLSLPCFKYFH